ncbi:hypothetical protein Tco_0029329 [Tanacetum coccineum]
MNMCPSQLSPPRTPGSNEYVPIAGVPSKNTRAFTCSYQFNPLKLIRNHFKSKETDIQEKDKNKAKNGQKRSTGMKKA